MFPCLAIDNILDRASVDPILMRQRGTRYSAVCVTLTYFTNLILCELGAVLTFTARLSGKVHTPFANHIARVVRCRAKKKMGGVYARGIVTTMAYLQAVWDRAKVNFVADTVRQVGAPMYAQIAISFAGYRTLPLPTFVIAILGYFGPKLIFDAMLWDGTAVVTGNEPNRLPLNPAFAGASLRGQPGLLSATAVAKTVWNFVRGLFGGMIVHVVSSFQLIGHATGHLQCRRGASIGFVHVYFSTNGRISQGIAA